MIRKVVLFGAGGHGRGTLEILRARIAAKLETPEPIGFVDDDESAQGSVVGGLPVRGSRRWLVENRDPELGIILALASARAKRELDRELSALGFRFASAIHPHALLGAGSPVADGAIVNAGVVTAYDTRIGRHVTVNLGATVGHDCVLGDFCTVAPGVNITGHVRIGVGAEIQTNATLVPGITVGAWSEVGPGAVVLRDVEDGAFVFGNPARKMPRLKA